VKDLGVSRAFYEKLGFEVTGGSEEENYLILINGEAIIGLFHGMFDRNILTFNPGLNNRTQQLDEFTDVREIQRTLMEQGIEVMTEVDESTSGAGSIMLVDPDGNPVLIDQFF
jgi:predicted lactoylglutathione lyase